MQQQSDSLIHQVVGQLRACGHFLYYRMGGKAGRQRILVTLLKHPEISQKDLQGILQIQSGSLSEVIIKLESDGLIEKVRSRKDGRQLTVRLTPDGKKEAESLKMVYEEKIPKMMDCLSPEELDNLHILLGKMLNHWEELNLSLDQKDSETNQ